MGESMSSLYRRGAISTRQLGRAAKPAILRKTSAQRSKMSDFDDKSKVDTKNPTRGTSAATGKTIDKNQGTGTPANAGGLPSKGARVNKTAQAGVGTINADQTPKFPAGGTVKKNSRPVGRHGLGGTTPGLRSSGPEYGGPSSRKYG
jgi:hypothetical protein